MEEYRDYRASALRILMLSCCVSLVACNDHRSHIGGADAGALDSGGADTGAPDSGGADGLTTEVGGGDGSPPGACEGDNPAGCSDGNPCPTLHTHCEPRGLGGDHFVNV